MLAGFILVSLDNLSLVFDTRRAITKVMLRPWRMGDLNIAVMLFEKLNRSYGLLRSYEF